MLVSKALRWKMNLCIIIVNKRIRFYAAISFISFVNGRVEEIILFWHHFLDDKRIEQVNQQLNTLLHSL